LSPVAVSTALMRSPSRLSGNFAHPVLGLHVPNDRLDRGATTHPAADRGGDTAHLAADPDAELLSVVVAAIAFVGRPVPKCGRRRDCRAVPWRTARTGRLWACWPGLPPIPRSRTRTARAFAFADAFDLAGVQRIDLGAGAGNDGTSLVISLTSIRSGADTAPPSRLGRSAGATL
jgi:hypothetical protein